MLIGLFVIFFIGKSFYNLAKKNNRHLLGYTLLGIGVYFGSQFVFGFLAGVVFLLSGLEYGYETEMILALIGFVLGLLCVWLLHYLLKRNWEGNPKKSNDELLDG